MGCGGGCNDNRPPTKTSRRITPRQFQTGMPSKEVVNSMNDKDFVLAEYMGSTGEHPVFGRSTGKKYGYKTRGDRFLVHKSDVAMQPNVFKAVSDHQEDPKHPVKKTKVTPPPKDIVPQDNNDELEEKPVVQKMIEQESFDLDSVPGVTDRAKFHMAQNNLTTPDAILSAGVVGLMQVKYIGKSRAESIMDYVEGRYGS